jgi:hypothetical protein
MPQIKGTAFAISLLERAVLAGESTRFDTQNPSERRNYAPNLGK